MIDGAPYINPLDDPELGCVIWEIRSRHAKRLDLAQRRAHIFKSGNGWECWHYSQSGNGYAGYGDTPAHAWESMWEAKHPRTPSFYR